MRGIGEYLYTSYFKVKLRWNLKHPLLGFSYEYMIFGWTPVPTLGDEKWLFACFLGFWGGAWILEELDFDISITECYYSGTKKSSEHSDDEFFLVSLEDF